MLYKLAYQQWWKIIGVVLVLYTVIAGMLLPVPALNILNETIRNLYYHVTMWFAMLFLLTVSLVNSIMYLNKQESYRDIVATEAARTAMLFASMGLCTGMIWAKFTWGAFWTNDPKLNGVAAALLVYAAYFLLRSSVEDEQKRARYAAVYNVFAYTMAILFIMILPRMTASLHPGNGGNPGFNTYDLDHNMRLVFWPAVLGWIVTCLWILTLRIRMSLIENKIED